MDPKKFRESALSVIDYMLEYSKTIELRPVLPDVKPHYLMKLMPHNAPSEPHSIKTLLEQMESNIMKGMTNWGHPQFHGYFPAGKGHPSVLADIVSGMLGIQGFSWIASPACTELEIVMLDWLGKAIGLPPEFLFYSDQSIGGGVIQGSASECVLVCMIAARAQALKQLKEDGSEGDTYDYMRKLVCYTSEEAHSCVQKAAMICMVTIRILASDKRGALQGEVVLKAMDEDVENGLVPFFISACLGTTCSTAFDNLDSIGALCKEHPTVWLHVDAAYGGNAFICPEFRHLMKGIEYADSFNMNPNKWMDVASDCSCMWVRDRNKLQESLAVDPVYLTHDHLVEAVDYRHWCIPLSRRMRSLKLWFTLSLWGVNGIQRYIRNHHKMAMYLESLIRKDPRFEVVCEVLCGLVCFRMKGEGDQLTQFLLSECNLSREIHLTPCVFKSKFIIRVSINYFDTRESDVDKSWGLILKHADQALKRQGGLHDTDDNMCFIHRTGRDVEINMFKLYDETIPIMLPPRE
uniref:Tyrosine decarboxylase n=3 Tax=Timema TaxID=61471 RepID=A0A7R9FKM6_9NEOP|nr:unnamed protein product [Timema bartmani]CAD7455353.1 unnamed protein product [Timema tahoe]